VANHKLAVNLIYQVIKLSVYSSTHHQVENEVREIFNVERKISPTLQEKFNEIPQIKGK
jgi:hypothetical protein